MKNHAAFTVTELIFVIVIIGILGAIAIPRTSSTILDAQIATAKADVASIRSAILSERQKRLLRGNNAFIGQLSTGGTGDDQALFGGDGTNRLLQYPKYSKNADGKWRLLTQQVGINETYAFKVNATDVVFTYTAVDGNFTCVRTATGLEGQYCQRISE